MLRESLRKPLGIVHVPPWLFGFLSILTGGDRPI
jgi:hypothetical protein